MGLRAGAAKRGRTLHPGSAAQGGATGPGVVTTGEGARGAEQVVRDHR